MTAGAPTSEAYMSQLDLKAFATPIKPFCSKPLQLLRSGDLMSS